MRSFGDTSPDGSPPPPGSPSAQTSHVEIAHVLFMDIVGYSRLRPDQQAAVQEELTRLVEDINEVEKARRNAQLIARPTGDGMSLLFFQNLLSPVHTALEIDRLLKRNNPGLKTRIGATIHLRMGIHSGPVMIVRDINGAVDVAGDGIVVAQRVMDAGDAGHILLSGSIVEGLQGIQPWSRFIHPLGEYHDKHGNMISLFTLVGQMPGYPSFGREDPPKKVLVDRLRTHQRHEQAEQSLKSLQRQDTQNSFLRASGILGAAILTLCVPGWLWFRSSPESFCDLFNQPACSTRASSPRRTELPLPEPTETIESGQMLPGNVMLREERHLVPALIGITMEQAEDLTTKKGLKVDFSEANPYKPDWHYANGIICRQSPAARTRAESGTTIYVSVSTGPPTQPTPPPDTDELPQPTPTTTPVPYTGVLLDARHLAAFDSRGPSIYLYDKGGNLICTSDYRVYDQEAGQEAAIRTRVGENPLRCTALTVQGTTGLVLNEEDSGRLTKMIGDNSNPHVGVLCQIR